jgi:O-antigen/teichoic acid export membrane protein
MYPYLKENVKLSKKETNGIFKRIGSAFLYKVSSVLINATDNTLISVLIGTKFVGYYSNYTLITTKLVSFVNTAFYSLTSSLGNLIVKEGKERRYQVFEIMQSVSVVLSTFCVTCVLFLLQDFIFVWLGHEYILDNLVVYALTTNFYFSISLLPIWVFREATGIYQKTKYVMLITALINVILSIVLGKVIGLAGIIFATSIARICTYFWYEPILLFKTYFGRSSAVYFIGILKSMLITALIFFVIYIVSNYIEVINWLTLILKGVVIATITIVLEFLIYHKSKGILLLKERVKNIIRR